MPTKKNVRARIAAETSWAHTADCSARTRLAREASPNASNVRWTPDGNLPTRRTRPPHQPRPTRLSSPCQR